MSARRSLQNDPYLLNESHFSSKSMVLLLPSKVDFAYVRNGVADMFMIYETLTRKKEAI